MGRWSRRLAPRFVEWAGVPHGAHVLDVGCGTGALSEAVLARDPANLVGIDLSPAFVDHARVRLGGPRARFEVASATAIPLPDASVDAAVSGLVLNFVPEPSQMLDEMRRVLAPGGLAALYVWDYAEGMQMMRVFWDAVASLDPALKARDEAARFALCRPDALARLFERASFADVETAPIVIDTRFEGFDDFWRPFLGGTGPAPALVASLDPARRDALREKVRAALPVGPDGGIALTARAWAVKGYSSAIS